MYKIVDKVIRKCVGQSKSVSCLLEECPELLLNRSGKVSSSSTAHEARLGLRTPLAALKGPRGCHLSELADSLTAADKPLQVLLMHRIALSPFYMFPRISSWPLHCLRLIASGLVCNCIGAVVSDGGGQVWQVHGFTAGRFQCIREGARAALPGLSPGLSTLSLACAPLIYTQVGHTKSNLQLCNCNAIQVTQCISMNLYCTSCSYIPFPARPRHVGTEISEKQKHLGSSFTLLRGSPGCHVLQALLRMNRPPSLSNVPPEEPPNPFTAQQNPFQPATPFGQVCHDLSL